MLRPLSLLLMALVILAAEDDPLVKELGRYDEAVAKLQKTYDDGVTKERNKSTPAIASIAKRLLAKGDMPGAVKAWKAVLRLDDQHPDARQFFTSIGQLDKVLAELESEESAGADLLGDGAGPVMGKPWQSTIVIQADKPLIIGDLPAGTQISLQYQSGSWTFRQGVQPMLSPDEAASRSLYRLVLATEAGVLQEIPPGTMQQAWTWTVPAEAKGALLRLSNASGRAPAGSVTYKATMTKPKAK
ncbi:MAG TPA: hypothetical protein DCS97_08310 [Planctomycetes bacterium]|nr:hypothetical protein [Planctomycetota bacterium]